MSNYRIGAEKSHSLREKIKPEIRNYFCWLVLKLQRCFGSCKRSKAFFVSKWCQPPGAKLGAAMISYTLVIARSPEMRFSAIAERALTSHWTFAFGFLRRTTSDSISTYLSETKFAEIILFLARYYRYASTQ